MKIALVSEWLDAWRGGAEASTLQFLRELVRRGVSVHVFTRSRPASTPDMQVHSVGGASMSRTRQSMTFMRRVERMIARDSFDIVHAITPCRVADIYQPRGGTVAETMARNLALIRSRAVRSIKRCTRALNLKQRYQLSVERALLSNPDGPIVIALSNYVVRQLHEHYQLPDSRIRLIFNAVEVDASPVDVREDNRREIRHQYGVADGDLLVLLVAHNFRLKGVDRWMEAHASLVRRGVRDVRTIVVGKGDSKGWRRRASKLGIDRYFTFAGPSDRAAAYRHAADVLVHPTFYDPCSRVVMEAMSQGLPCVATRWDGSAELIDDGRNGFVVEDPGDITALADRVERLRDPNLRAQMGAAALEVADRVDMRRHVAEMLKVYEELANRPHLKRNVSLRPAVTAS